MTGEELRAIRERWGFTQRRMAKELRISQSYIAMMEIGVQPIPVDVAAMLGAWDKDQRSRIAAWYRLKASLGSL